jgi:hypothetical protein
MAASSTGGRGPAVLAAPSVGLYATGDPISERVDELLADGFGLR